MKGRDLIPKTVEWSETTFDALFKHADADGNGFIDYNELEGFCKDLILRLSGSSMFCSGCSEVIELGKKKWVCKKNKCDANYCKKCGPSKVKKFLKWNDYLKQGYVHNGQKQGAWVEVYKQSIEFNRWDKNELSGTCVTLHVEGAKTITIYTRGYKRQIKFFGPDQW